MTPFEAPSGSVWEFEGELFVMLDVMMDLKIPYRLYLSLDSGQPTWIGRGSERDDCSEWFA